MLELELELEDSPPNTYYWTKASEINLEVFLQKYKPSLVQNDGTKPWIWVRGDHHPPTGKGQKEEALNAASTVLKEATEKVDSVKNDPSIPMRSNKKTGAKSKKETREKVQTEATDALQRISQEYGYVDGKWLVFASPDKVDTIWANIAKSLVSGPLASTAAYLAKVSTSPQYDTPNYQHVICLYIPDVYDKESVTEVMKTLLRHHGVNLSGVKSDLYTLIGLDSKHPSGIPSTIWKNLDLLPETEIKTLKDEFFAALAAKDGELKTSSMTEVDTTKKARPKLKKKKADDDPFASDDEDTESAPKKRRRTK